MCVCGGGGGGVGAVVQSTPTLHKNSDTLHNETLSLSLSLSVKSGSCSYQSCKQKDLGSIPLQLSFPALEKGCGLWRLSCDLVPHN